MATLNVVSMEGASVGTVDLSDQVFNAPVKEHLLWEVVVAQRAARRSGSASTKTRGKVKGTTHKVYRQKGTGRARHGGPRAPIYVGGGIAHGPQPRSYAQRTPKRVRRNALISALSLRNQESKLVVIDSLKLDEIRTKRVVTLLERLGVDSGLIVDTRDNSDLIKSVRNLPNARFLPPEGLNVSDVLRYKTLLLTVDVAKQLEERLAR